MVTGDVKFAFAEFVERNRLKPGIRGNDYGGLCHGLAVLATEYDGMIRVYLHSPAIQLSPDLIFEKFQSFENVAAAGIPTHWISGNVLENTRLDLNGCFIDLTRQRLEQIPSEVFLGLPEIISRDLEPYRTTSEPIGCSRCGTAVATQLFPTQLSWLFRCDSCIGTFEESEPPVRWRPAAAVLLGGTILFALGWGLVQQPSVRGHDAEMLLVAPLIAAITLCRTVARYARGTSLSLRLITATCILLAVLSGNVWGFRSALRELGWGEVPWPDAIAAYFLSLPDNTNAGWYLLGGLAGTWLGFGILGVKPDPEPLSAAIEFPPHASTIGDNQQATEPSS